MAIVGRCNGCGTMRKLWSGKGQKAICRECFEKVNA